MPSPVQKAFERLDLDIRSLEFDTSLKILALKQCDFLLNQTNLPFAQRIPSNQLLHTWRLFLETLKKAAIYHFIEEKDYFEICANFSGDKYRGAIQTRSQAAKPPLKFKTETDFFKYLLKELNNLDGLLKDERWLMYLSVRTLIKESELPLEKRDPKFLLPVWKMIYPRLKARGLLEGLKTDRELREKLTMFFKKITASQH